MAAGALGLVLTAWVWSSRRRSTRTTTESTPLDESTDVGPSDVG
jgi:hypothetical protein